MSRSRRDQRGKRIAGEVLAAGDVRIDPATGKVRDYQGDAVGSLASKRWAKRSARRARRRIPVHTEGQS